MQMNHGALSIGLGLVNVPLFVLIIGAGLLGQDLSDGILPLALSRPIRRWRYVLSKYLAVSSLATALSLLNLTLLWFQVQGLRFDNVGFDEVVFFLQVPINAFGTGAVLLLFSSILPGAADVAVIILLTLFMLLLSILEEVLRIPGMNEISTNLSKLVYPTIQLEEMVSMRSLICLDVGLYLTVVILCLTGAVLIINQKELSYGSG
ncbi:MAG: ABC transporter permease subunit [Candidatus Obscuribacterales bacterium]